jgi:O-antigen/teichoic acid export membrane protein
MLKRLGKDLAVYGGADLLFKLVQFAVIPIYSRLLTVAEFGILALLQVSATLIGILVNLGVSYAVQRFYFDKDIPAERRPLLVTTGLLQLVLSAALMLCAIGIGLHAVRDYVALEYGIAWTLVILALATVLPDQVAQYALDTSRLQFAPFKFCAVALVKNVAGLLLGLWLLIDRDLGIAGLLIGNLAAAFAAVPLGLWLVRRDLTFGIDREYLGTLLRFGSPFIFTAAAYWAFGSLDRWMLAEMSDAVEVGLFSIAFKFASVLTLVIAAFHQAWIPLAMKMTQEEPGYRSTFSTIFSLWLFLLALMALGMAMFSDEVMVLLTPEPYWAAAPALALGAAAIALSGTTQITTLGVTLAKRPLLIATGAWLTALINIGLNLLLIPPFGATGSAGATLLSYGFLTLFYLFWSQRLHRLPLEHGKLLYGAAILAAAVAAPWIPDGAPLSPVSILVKLSILLAALLGAVPAGLLDSARLRQIITRSGKQAL